MVGVIVYLSRDKQEVTIEGSGSWMVLSEVFLENFTLWNNPRPSIFISMCSRILNVQFFGAFRRFKMICLCDLKPTLLVFTLLISQQCDFGEHLQISAGKFIHPFILQTFHTHYTISQKDEISLGYCSECVRIWSRRLRKWYGMSPLHIRGEFSKTH